MIPCGDGLAVSRAVSAGDLRQLLHGIRVERCAHSWRNFDPDGSLEQLQAWENRLRPTTIFFYYGAPEGADAAAAPRLAAAATVADVIRREFPHAGFPVLARCYVMPDFRSQGLYQRIVHHRLEFCRTRFAGELKAIHLGTQDERVARTVTRGEPRFVQLGSEVVQAGDEACLVRAFLHLTPGYLASITSSLQGDDPPPPVRQLVQSFSQMLDGAPGDHALSLRERFASAQSTGWFAHHDPSSIEQLLTLCRAIPLLGFR